MTFLVAVSFLALGAAAGAVHFAMIAWDAGLTVAGGPASRIAWARIGRLIVSTGTLVLAALSGWLPLLAATLGMMASRQWALHRFGRPG